MKFAYFNPTVVAVEDIPVQEFSAFRQMTEQAHLNKSHNDEGNPNISIRGGQQIQLLPNEVGLDITPLKIYIEECCKEYIKNIVSVQNTQELEPYTPMLVSAWTIKQTSGDYQALHNHEAHISGNMYLEVPDWPEDSKSSDGHVEFRLPVPRDASKFIFNDQWRFKPQMSKMIIFPSYIPHTVYPWKGNGNRTILAWDVKLVPKDSV